MDMWRVPLLRSKMRIETHPCVAANVGYFAQKITPRGMTLVESDPLLSIASILKHSWLPNICAFARMYDSLKVNLSWVN
jgi:hypothetical protein